MTGIITDDWLRECGFKWEQLERQPTKHWTLWLGSALRDPCNDHYRRGTDSDSLGIELAKDSNQEWWYCWLRSDFAGRYSRFIHIRHVQYRSDVAELIGAITGRPWVIAHALYGSLRDPLGAERLLAERERLDRRIAQSRDAVIARETPDELDKLGTVKPY